MKAIGLLLLLCAVAAAQPRPPVARQLHIELAEQIGVERMPIASLSLDTEYSPDTVLLEVTLDDQLGPQRFTTEPAHTHLVPDLQLKPGMITATVVAIDRAGQRSGTDALALVTEAVVVPRHRIRCGMGATMLIFVAPILLLGLLIGVAVVIALWRRRTPGKGPGEAVPPLVADHLARAVLRSASSWCAAYAVAVIGVLAMGEIVLALALATFSLIPLSSVIAARRVLRELGAEQARAELRGTVLIVRSERGQARVAGSSRQIGRSRAHAVPTSTAL